MPLETPLLAQHKSAGAEIGEYFGTFLPTRFADFSPEYAAARRAVGLVDSNYRAVFSFSGPDAQRYLNAVLTSNVRDLKPGMGAVGLLLTPQGHILAEVETLAQADRILAVSHGMVRERTLSTFNKFIIMDDVALESSHVGGSPCRDADRCSGTSHPAVERAGIARPRSRRLPCRNASDQLASA